MSTGAKDTGAPQFATLDTIDASELPSGAHADHDVAPGTAVGRYIVLHALGEGGNGVVYAAYDPELDRKVALKLVRPTARNHARLLREAQALARLSHPNVVAVHDVGSFEDRVFVAMELVEGSNLREWLRSAPRSVREILRVYLAAGDGLAAAHARGLVHRDVKPDNVLLGHDGAVRVVDFGLATRADSQDEPEHAPDLTAQAELGTLTQVGAVMGTPGYMAPEQYLAAQGDARTDQFSFCVALHEALYGVLPFAGDTVSEVQAATCEGKLRAPPPERRRKVPSRIQRAIERGLAVERTRRWDSMAALLAELRYDPSVVLRRVLLVALACLALAASALLWLGARARTAATCTGGDELVLSAYNPELAQRITRVFAGTGFSYAPRAQSAVISALEHFAGDYRSARQEACVATRVRGEQSEEVMAARLSCLDAELEEVRSFARLMASGEREVVPHAVEASSLLPRVGDCANVSALLSQAKVPDDARLRGAVDGLRRELAGLRALISAGSYARANTQLAELVGRARATGYAPVLAEALLELGHAQQGLGEYAAAEATLHAAETSADEGHHDVMRAQAIVDRVEVTGRWLGHYLQAERDAERAASVARRVHHPELEWSALDAQSRVHAYLGKLDQAVIEGQHSVELAIKLFGPSDLRVARAHGAISIALADLDRLDEAIREDMLALTISERALGSAHPALVRLLTNVSTGYAWSGRFAEALPYARRAQELAERELGEHHSQHGLAWNTLGYIHVGMGQFREGLEANARSLAIYEHQDGTDYVETVYPLVGIGEAQLGLGEPEAALATLERAARICDAHELDAETEGVCHFHRGRALWLARHERARALELVQRAVQDFAPVPRLSPLKLRAQEWLLAQGANVRR